MTPPHRAFCSSSFPCTCVDSVYFALKAPKKAAPSAAPPRNNMQGPAPSSLVDSGHQPSSPDNKSTIKPTEQQRKHVAGCVFPGFYKTAEPPTQTILSCRSGSKSSWFVAGGFSSSLPGRGVLTCTPASAGTDSLPSAWDFSPRDSWEEEGEQEAFSGMNTATRKATTTVHAPRRKGGPGMRPRCHTDGKNTPWLSTHAERRATLRRACVQLRVLPRWGRAEARGRC